MTENIKNKSKIQMSFFDKYLSIWVLICMAIGILIGHFAKIIPDTLNSLTISGISVIIMILIWIMIFPVMIKMDFKKVFNIKQNKKPLLITTIVNWLVKPFSMYGIAMLFFKVIFVSVFPIETSNGYIAGLVILAAAPCTAMVFVWSSLTKGDHNYTLSQVIINDTIMLFAFVPIVGLLLKVSNVNLDWKLLFYSILLFIVVPLTLAIIFRWAIIRKKSKEFLDEKVVGKLNYGTMVGLLLTLIIIFMSQSENIFKHPTAILIICIPVIIQTTFTFTLLYFICLFFKIPQKIVGPATTIGSSNFFELALATSVALFGPTSSATLAVTVGIIIEVPLMLTFVTIVNKTENWYSNKIRIHKD